MHSTTIDLAAIGMAGEGHYRTRAEIPDEVFDSRLSPCQSLEPAYGLLQIRCCPHPLGERAAFHLE